MSAAVAGRLGARTARWFLGLALACGALLADPPPIYDPMADAGAAVKAALEGAAAARVRVMVVFGADWCGDCRALDAALKSADNAPLVEKHFKVVKVNVGKFDKNLELAASYGLPLKRGIPGLVLLTQAGKVAYVTKSGELASARKMGAEGIHEFLVKLAQRPDEAP